MAWAIAAARGRASICSARPHTASTLPSSSSRSGALEVMALLASLDQEQGALGAQDGDREPGNPAPEPRSTRLATRGRAR